MTATHINLPQALCLKATGLEPDIVAVNALHSTLARLLGLLVDLSGMHTHTIGVPFKGGSIRATIRDTIRVPVDAQEAV